MRRGDEGDIEERCAGSRFILKGKCVNLIEFAPAEGGVSCFKIYHFQSYIYIYVASNAHEYEFDECLAGYEFYLKIIKYLKSIKCHIDQSCRAYIAATDEQKKLRTLTGTRPRII